VTGAVKTDTANSKETTAKEKMGMTLLIRSTAPPRPEPFGRLKALSSIEGLESKANPDF
jgi:hypothetical protein